MSDIRDDGQDLSSYSMRCLGSCLHLKSLHYRGALEVLLTYVD